MVFSHSGSSLSCISSIAFQFFSVTITLGSNCCASSINFLCCANISCVVILRSVSKFRLFHLAVLPDISKTAFVPKRDRKPRRSFFACGGVFYLVLMINSAEPAGPVMVSAVLSLTFVNVRTPSAPFVTVQLAGSRTVKVKSVRRCLFQ